MGRKKSLSSNRLFKITLVFATFFSIPLMSKNTIIAVTSAETAPESNFKSKPLTKSELVYHKLISKAGEKYGVDPRLIRAVITQESGFKQHARSHKNAQGLMQLIPATAQRFGITDPYDPKQNIDGGTRYLRWLLNRFDGDVKLALAGYNAGENAVKKYGNQVPPYEETQNYVKKITAAYGKTHHAVPPPMEEMNPAVVAVQ